MPAQIREQDLELLRQAETGTIGHFRFHGFVRSPVKLLTPPKGAVVGTAVTLMLPALDSTLLHHAVGLLRPGDVLLIDRLGDTEIACLGGGVAHSIKQMGAAGVIVDGPCADPHELRDIDLPIWAHGYSAVTTRLLDIWGALNEPVCCSGTVVHPGDAVLADENGVIVLPPGEVAAVAKQAIDLQSLEKQALPIITRENPIGGLTGATKLVDTSMSEG